MWSSLRGRTRRGRRRRMAGRGWAQHGSPAARASAQSISISHRVQRSMPSVRNVVYEAFEHPAVDPPTSAVVWSPLFRLVASFSIAPMCCQTFQQPFSPSDVGSKLWHLAFLLTSWPTSIPPPLNLKHTIIVLAAAIASPLPSQDEAHVDHARLCPKNILPPSSHLPFRR